MAYVEYIKVNNGESWKVRDTEAQEAVNNVNATVAGLQDSLASLNGKVNTNTSNISASASNVSSLTNRVTTLETKMGGVLTIVWPDNLKGTSWPSNPTTGQIFLKKV